MSLPTKCTKIHEAKAVSFNDEMVRAIMREVDPKTQTRRPLDSVLGIGRVTEFQESNTPGYDFIMRDSRLRWNDLKESELLERSPFGQVGDLLWVRESATVRELTIRRVKFRYEADGVNSICQRPDRIAGLREGKKMANGIFREAARTFLRVKRVWVQRIQDISEADAKAEGAKKGCAVCQTYGFCGGEDYRQGFANLWCSIYEGTESSWGKNPWVWGCEWEVVK